MPHKNAKSREIASGPVTSKANSKLTSNAIQEVFSIAASTLDSESSELSSGYKRGSSIVTEQDVLIDESIKNNKNSTVLPGQGFFTPMSSLFSAAIPLPDTATYYRQKYSGEAQYILYQSLDITENAEISPDYNYVPRKFFIYLRETIFKLPSSNESINLLEKFFLKFQVINEALIHALECYMMERYALIEAIDYYNKFYYFERSRGGASKAFFDEKKLEELGINKIVKNIFLLEFKLFFNATAQNNFALLQSSLSNILEYFIKESPVIQESLCKIKKSGEFYYSFIDLSFKDFLSANFLKIKNEIYFLDNHVHTFVLLSKNFFSQLKLGIFLRENLLARLKKNIYWNQREASYEQQVVELIAKLKKLSWFKLFFIGIFFWSIQSKKRIFEKIESNLIASIYKEKLTQIKALKTSLEQSLSSLNTDAYNFNENQILASNFVSLVSIVNSLVAYPISQHLDIPSFVKMEGLTNAERTKLIETVKLFTRPMSFYWENCLLPREEEKINKNMGDSEREQSIILKKIEKLRQDLQKAIKRYERNSTCFSVDYKAGLFAHQKVTKPVIEANLSRKPSPVLLCPNPSI